MIKTITARALPWWLLLLLFAECQNLFAQTPQPGFASVVVSDQWNEAVGLTFTNDGVDMFVWERGGKVHVVTEGVKRLVLDISEEVGAWHDHGMLGFALHPQFDQNGYIYLLYIVDRHHLINFGTAAYSSTVNDYFSATIGRLTRYTLTKSGGIY
ncbi:MAG TPA: PQQ-dependent sugar dehydrogenase, partial [Chryseolinea sp.]